MRFQEAALDICFHFLKHLIGHRKRQSLPVYMAALGDIKKADYPAGMLLPSGIIANVYVCDAGLEYARDCVHSLRVYVCDCALQ